MAIEFILDDVQKQNEEKINEILDVLKKPQTENILALHMFTKAMFQTVRKKAEKKKLKKLEKVKAEVEKPAQPLIPKTLIKIPELMPAKQVEKIPKCIKPRKITAKNYPLVIDKESNRTLAHAEVDHIYKVFEPAWDENDFKVLKFMEKKFGRKAKKLVEKKEKFEKVLQKVCKKFDVKYSENFAFKQKYYLLRNLNFGKVDALLHDKKIKSVSCDGVNVPVSVDYDGRNLNTNVIYKDKEKLELFIKKLAEKARKKVSVKHPILEGNFENYRIQGMLGNDVVNSKFVIKKLATKKP